MIGIIYFVEKLDQNRKHHEVNDILMSAWLHCYRKSGTTIKPCLLTDQTTEIPKQWPYEIVRLQETNPPVRKDVLNKVGWMKAQGYAKLGKCIIMDLDCMILRPIDELYTLNAPMAMPIDPAKRTYPDWPEVGEELNAGTMLFNSENILPRFKQLWEEKNHYIKITYFDEIIFSAICRETKGIILNEHWNSSWPVGDDIAMQKVHNNPETKILHFHGQRKSQLDVFYRSRLA